MISSTEIAEILRLPADSQALTELRHNARHLTDEVFGRNVYARGLIEVSNICHNDCLYCGIRMSNRNVTRYALTEEEIVETAGKGYAAGLRTFVLQGGESQLFSAAKVAPIVRRIKKIAPDAAVTLSLGEMEDDEYALLRDAGADRYLLRHETFNPDHYRSLHPAAMSRDNRLRALRTLKRLGFQTGTGIMVGTPGQTIEHILEDINFMLDLQPEMIGLGPFIPAAGTPLAGAEPGSAERTIRLLSILRLLFPNALLPATTAVATLRGTEGRIAALDAGANVVMPNISPNHARNAYQLYNNKAVTGLEAAEHLRQLADNFASHGYNLALVRGDFNTDTK